MAGRVELGKGGGDRAIKPLVELGQGLKQHYLEVVQSVIDFIEHRGLKLVQLVGAPPEANLFGELVLEFFHFPRRG